MASTSLPVFYEDDQYEIRPAKHVKEYKNMWWSFMQGLGWNRGFYDLESYMNPSISSGMILLMDKSSGKPVGHVSAVVNSNQTGWISMFIIDESHRGKGMGRELFKAAMKDAERHGATIMGLDGVAEQKATYERRRFVESPLGLVKIMVRDLVSKSPLPADSGAEPHGEGLVVDIREVHPKFLAEHELKYTGFERPMLWSDEHMFSRPDVSGVALVSRSPPQTADDIEGWIILRRCSAGLRLGPLYAQDSVSARAILVAAMNLAKPKLIKDVPLPGEPISDLPENEISEKAMLASEVWCGNPEALNLFQGLGWKEAGVDYHRMWVDAKATPEWEKGGLAQQGVFAIFDAATG